MSPSSQALRFVQRRVPLLRELPIEVTGVSAIAFFVALGFGIVAPIIPTFARSFGVTALAASAVISVFAGMRLVAAPPASWMLSKFGERRVLTAGLLIVSLSSGLAGLSQTFIQLLVLRGIGGIGSTMFTVASMALLLRVVDASQRGRAASAWSGGFLTGGLAGPAVGGFFAVWSLRAPFFVYATTLFMAAIVSWKSLKNAHLISDAPSDEIVEEAARISTLRQAIKQRAYRAAVAVNFSTGFVRFGLLSALAPLFVVEALKANAGLASTGFLFSAAGQALLLSRAGRWTDDKGRKPVMLIGGTLTVTGLVLLAFYETIPGYLIAMLILGASGAFMSSAPTAVVGDVTGGKPRGQVLSTYQMSSDFGAIFGPLAAGWLLDASGVFSTPLLIAAALMMVVIYLVWAMPETKPQEVERS
jgi:MFS family permease